MIKFNDLQSIIESATREINEKMLYKDTAHSGLQPWSEIIAQMKANAEQKSPEEQARIVYATAFATVSETERKFSRLLKKISPKDSKILVDIKKEDAFVDKVVNRGKSAEKITDVLRGAVLVETEKDMDKLIANLQKHADIFEHEIKTKREDPEYGYHGSHHFLIVIDDVLIELQAMTKRLWTFKEPAHEIYSKWRSVKEFDDRIAKKEKEYSKNLFIKGNLSPYDLEQGERLAKRKDIRRGKFSQKYKFTN